MRPALQFVAAVAAVLALVFWLSGERGDGDPHPPQGASPSLSGPQRELPALTDVTAAEARAALDDIEIAPAERVDYNRVEQFGRSWAFDFDNNGCDTRNDVLGRDLTDVVTSDGCTVLTGVLDDPYTGVRIDFQRGQETSAEVQIDHLVPLSWAARHGALDWGRLEREGFANDPMNLLAVDGPTNTAKGDAGPADWLPPAETFHCTYVTGFVAVVDHYELTMSHTDAEASRAVLEAC